MKIFKLIYQALVYVFTLQFVHDYKMKKLADQTSKVAIDLAGKRATLKSKINHYVRLHYGVAANSDFIPVSGVNSARLRKDIEHKFGHLMTKYSLTLTRNLRWK